jgi:hypothetical protein
MPPSVSCRAAGTVMRSMPISCATRMLFIDKTPLKVVLRLVEKRKPHHNLDAFKRAFRANGEMTVTARKDADRLGYLDSDILHVIDRMGRKDFVKSMTAHFDGTKWQDVYNVRDGDYLLYVKFTDHVVTAFVLLSFKEK